MSPRVSSIENKTFYLLPMILISLILVYIPFVSLPNLLFSSYTQPVPLFLGWLYLVATLKLSVSQKLALPAICFLIYIVLLGFFLYDDFALVGAYLNVFIAYCIGFMSLFLFFSLFRQALRRLEKSDVSLAHKILNSARLTLLIVTSTLVLQINPIFSNLLILIKSRHVDLDGKLLTSALRGLSGILPEPSYVGMTCATLTLVIYWFSFRLFTATNRSYFHESLFTYESSSDYLGPRRMKNSPFYLIYNLHLAYFFSSRLNQALIIASFISIILALSPTSAIVYTSVLSSVLLPLLLNFLKLRFSPRLFLYFSVSIIFLVLFSLILYFYFPDSRVSNTVNNIITEGLFFIVSGSDSSAADRSASSIAGLFSIFYYPFGLGLNGHGSLFADCGRSIIIDFDLLCGSIYSSSRNHNSLATYLMDGGVISVLTASFAFGRYLTNSFAKSFGSFALLGRLSLVYLAFLFVVLPSPLGAPSTWMVLALILSIFSVPADLESPIPK